MDPKQHAEKLIPTIIQKALSKEALPIYGFVADRLDMIDAALLMLIRFRMDLAGRHKRTLRAE